MSETFPGDSAGQSPGDGLLLVAHVLNVLLDHRLHAGGDDGFLHGIHHAVVHQSALLSDVRQVEDVSRWRWKWRRRNFLTALNFGFFFLIEAKSHLSVLYCTVLCTARTSV